MKFTIKDVLRILLVLSCVSVTQIKSADALTPAASAAARPTAAEEEEESCAICLAPLKSSPDGYTFEPSSVLLSCGHKFHTMCEMDWQIASSHNLSCALCRQASTHVAETFSFFGLLSLLHIRSNEDVEQLKKDVIFNAVPEITLQQLTNLMEHPLITSGALIVGARNHTGIRVKILEIINPEAITEEERQTALAEYEAIIQEEQIKKEKEEEELEEKRRVIQNATLLKLMATSIVAYRVLCKISGVDYK